MARLRFSMVDRLVKESFEIAAACFFHGTFEIARIHQLARILRSVECYSAPKFVVAQFLPQSVEEQSAFYVWKRPQRLMLIFPLLPMQRAVFPLLTQFFHSLPGGSDLLIVGFS